MGSTPTIGAQFGTTTPGSTGPAAMDENAGKEKHLDKLLTTSISANLFATIRGISMSTLRARRNP